MHFKKRKKMKDEIKRDINLQVFGREVYRYRIDEGLTVADGRKIAGMVTNENNELYKLG